MLNVESIQNGVVIDHIPAGKGMDIYRLLELESKTQSVALLQSVKSQKYGCKDLIKIEGETLPERLDVLGYLDEIPVCTGYEIDGEFAANGFRQNDLVHETGVLSMARAMDPNSAGSQFFIMHKTSPHLDGAYAAFGKVTEGMDVVNKIAETATDYSDRPLEEQKMKKVTVETFGEAYPEPERV